MISVLLPSRVADLHPVGKVAALAAVLTIGSAITAVAQPAAGALSDRTRTPLGRRVPWMIAGALLGGLAIGLIGEVPTVVLVAALWALAQPFTSALQVSSDAFLVDAFPIGRRGRAAGIVGIAVVVGSAAGAVLSGALANRGGLVFWLLDAALVIAVAIFAVVVRDTTMPALDRPRRRSGDALRALAAGIAAHPDYLKILLWRFGYSIAYGAVFAYLLYILTDLVGVTKEHAANLIGLATVLGGGAALVSVLLGGWLSDRLGRRPFLLIGNAALIAGDLALLVSHTVPAVLTTAALFGLGLGLSISCGRALASQVLPDQANGAAAGLGVLNTAANAGQAIAPAIGAVAIGLAGYPGALLTSIVGAIVCSAAVALVKTVR